jgi:hypothetical protein
MFDFLTALMVVWGRETGRDLWIGLLTFHGLGRELFFSGAVTLSNSVGSA